jgi:hypothetical protein
MRLNPEGIVEVWTRRWLDKDLEGRPEKTLKDIYDTDIHNRVKN